tara:strand:+ start:145 stop:588 length:444 start_codon:yes stop_codon:yes gene_type:complete
MKVPLQQLIQILTKNAYMIEKQMFQLKYYLQNDIIEYKQYVKFNDDHYSKQLVYKNYSFEAYVICWKPGQSSNIHSHPKNGCIMKVLEGTLREERYGTISITEKICKKNDILFIRDTDQHVIENISDTKPLITLHIYSPPGFYKHKL